MIFESEQIRANYELGVLAGVAQERDRIIKLLEDDELMHNTAFEPQTIGKNERFEYMKMCFPFCPGCETIALIKGEK